MTQITLKAGDIRTDIRSDDNNPENLAEVARDLQEWQFEQWTRVSGSAVQTVPSISFD